MTRSIQEFSAEEFIHIGKVIIANVADPMQIIIPLCIAMVALSTWKFYREKSVGFYPAVTALVLMIVTLLITVLVEVVYKEYFLCALRVYFLRALCGLDFTSL